MLFNSRSEISCLVVIFAESERINDWNFMHVATISCIMMRVVCVWVCDMMVQEMLEWVPKLLVLLTRFDVFFLVNSLLLGDRFRIQERIDDIAIAVAMWKWIALIFFKCSSGNKLSYQFPISCCCDFVACFTLLRIPYYYHSVVSCVAVNYWNWKITNCERCTTEK